MVWGAVVMALSSLVCNWISDNLTMEISANVEGCSVNVGIRGNCKTIKHVRVLYLLSQAKIDIA